MDLLKLIGSASNTALRYKLVRFGLPLCLVAQLVVVVDVTTERLKRGFTSAPLVDCIVRCNLGTSLICHFKNYESIINF
jgi:hypothetical protein